MTAEVYPDTAPFTDLIGMRLLSSKQNEVKLQMTQRGELNNRRGLIHGGVLATSVSYTHLTLPTKRIV